MSLEHGWWPIFASWQCSHSPLLNEPHLSPPLLSAVWKIGSDCCYDSTKQACFYDELGQNGDTFHLNFFPHCVCGECFFAGVTKELLEGESCCYVTLYCLIHPAFCPRSLLAVTTAVKRLGIVEPHCTLQGSSSLTPDRSSPVFFFLHSSLWAGQLRPKNWRQ